MGVFWGLSFSFTRMAVENGGTPLGIAFWQSIISSVILLSFSSLRGRHFTLRRHHIGPFIIIALLGVGVPGVAFFIAASRVPSGILAITVTLVPILTYCMALSLRIEAFSVIRICGVFCGAQRVAEVRTPGSRHPRTSAWRPAGIGAGLAPDPWASRSRGSPILRASWLSATCTDQSESLISG